MAAKCPLCFRKLDPLQQLDRVCLTHKDRHRAFFFDIDRRKDLLCPVKSCETPRSIQSGVFLRHIGCTARNPYWDEHSGTVKPPDGDAFTREGRVFHVQHWLFGALRELAEIEPKAPEMWFPLQMFRTVNWYSLDEGKSIGASVRLAGAKNAGKTVLATMALVPYGYMLPGDGPAFRVENWVYVSPAEGEQRPQDQFLQALLPFSLLRDQQNNPEWVTATPATQSNVKAAFLRANPENRDLSKELLNYVFNAKEPWRSLLFYDTAGEENEKPREQHREQVDIGAVVLDGSGLAFFGESASPNARTASERLATIAANRKCVLVTKSDLIDPKLLLPAECQVLARLRAGEPVAPNAEREMVQRWLRAPKALPAERELAGQLSNLEVFVVWTEGLNDTTPGRLPQTFGLRKFVSWCLDGSFAVKKKAKVK